MRIDFKLIGSILLIVGTSIGAGMLALPIATAKLGFLGSVILLIGCWLMMTFSAFILLEVNLWLPQRSNIISMARSTLGMTGQMLAWLTYLLLLYSLLCAYIAGGSDLFHNLFVIRHIKMSEAASALLFTLIFSSVVFCGIKFVDYTNRALMIGKFAAYFLLIFLLIPFISLGKLASFHVRELSSATAIAVTLTSFGYSPIVPSLRVYFAGDIRKLRQAILYGSLIPLVCYILWDAVIMGVLPITKIMQLLTEGNSTSALVNILTQTINTPLVTFIVKAFTSICMLTSFLGVGLCLTDFLADGLGKEKKGSDRFLIHALTFIPPLLIVLFYPHAFIKALEYAGIYCVILLVLLPALMAWRGRYVKHINTGKQVIGGPLLLLTLILASIFFIGWSIGYELGFFAS